MPKKYTEQWPKFWCLLIHKISIWKTLNLHPKLNLKFEGLNVEFCLSAVPKVLGQCNSLAVVQSSKLNQKKEDKKHKA